MAQACEERPAEQSPQARKTWSNNAPPVEGYPKLAHQMGKYPETAIMRRFSSLNAQNLLYLQAGITHLEIELRELETSSSKDQDAKKHMYARDWYWLKTSVEEGDGAQWETVLKIREMLRVYNDALLQHVALSALPQPTKYSLRSLQDWIEGRGEHSGNYPLKGEDSKIWGSSLDPESQALDLVAIKAEVANDLFSRWVVEHLIVWFFHLFHRKIDHGPEDVEAGSSGPIGEYNDEIVLRYASHITTIIASLLPIVSTVVLYFVQSKDIKVILAAVFTFVFVACFVVFTRARRVEVFIAAAAFAAVQVVFISGN